MSLYLTAKDPSGPSEEWLPLYRRVDGEEVAAAMPVFDEFRLVRAGPPPPPTSLVDLSSGDQFSEATEDEVVEESSAPRQRELLRDFPDDDDDDAPLVVEVPRPFGVTTRSGVSSSKQPKQTVTKKGMTSLIPPGSVPRSPTAPRAAPTVSYTAPKSSAPAAPP